MSKKTHRLALAMEEDFCLLGMVSDAMDYRLCWLLNRQLGTDFRKQDDLLLYHKKLDADQEVSHFCWHDETAMLTYRIIKNRADPGFFLDDIKNLDYFALIQGEVYESKVTAFMQAASEISEVRMCIPVELASIRQQERLMLW